MTQPLLVNVTFYLFRGLEGSLFPFWRIDLKEGESCQETLEKSSVCIQKRSICPSGISNSSFSECKPVCLRRQTFSARSHLPLHRMGYICQGGEEVMQTNYQSGDACCFTGREPGLDPTQESNVVLA